MGEDADRTYDSETLAGQRSSPSTRLMYLCIAATRSDDAEVSAAGTLLMTRYQRFIFENLPANWPDAATWPIEHDAAAAWRRLAR